MLIDNKVDRYPDDGFDIRTVWDFIMNSLVRNPSRLATWI